MFHHRADGGANRKRPINHGTVVRVSKKSSPQSRPARRPRTRGPQQTRVGGHPAASTAKSAKTAPRGAGNEGAAKQREAPVNFWGRFRRYLPTALIPNVVAVLSVIVVALAVLLLGSVEMAALPATIAQFWLLLNLVPVTYEDATIGMLPMLPAIGLVWLIARQVHKAVRDRVSVADLGVLLLSVLVVPLALTGIAAGMLWDASTVYEVTPPEIPQLLARVVVLHLVAMVLGMGAKLWRALFRRYGLPEAFVDNARSALRWLGYLGLAALVVLLIAMAVGWQRQAELADIYNSAGALVALGAVSLLYLPNALIGVAAVLVGAEFHVGEASLSLFSIHHTPLPPMPLIAAIPPESQVWFPALLVIPAAIAGYLAYRANPTLISATATGLFAGLFALVAGYLSQGDLGAFGQSGPMVLLAAGLAVVWLAAAGIATALLLKLAERRLRRAAAVSGETAVDEPEDADADEAEDGADVDDADVSDIEEDSEIAAEDDEDADDSADPEEESAAEEVTVDDAAEDEETSDTVSDEEADAEDSGDDDTEDEEASETASAEAADDAEDQDTEDSAVDDPVDTDVAGTPPLSPEPDSEPETPAEADPGEAEGPPEPPKR